MTGDLDTVVRNWAQAYTGEVLEFAQPAAVNDSEVFGDVYHSLIHSPLSETLLQLEASYAMAVEAVCRERDTRGAEMEAGHQIDEKELLVSKFESELATLHRDQLREFREW